MKENEIIKLDKKVAVIENKIDNLAEKIDAYQTDNKADHKAVRELIEAINEKKADKDAVDKLESNQAKVVWAVIIAVLGAVLSLVIKR
jgi:predicted metalloenzyme YecM